MLKWNVQRDEARCDLVARLAVWNDDLEYAQPGGVGWRRRRATAGPGVETDVVMVAASGEEGSMTLHIKDQIESQKVAVKADRAVQVSDLEMDMADAGPRR